jgi:hypothetical protein
MPEPALRHDGGDQLLACERTVGERDAGGTAETLDLLRGKAEVLLPARPLPRAPGGHEREERSGLVGLQEMKRAAHRPGLDQAAVAERARDLSARRGLLAHAYRELRGRCDLRLDTAEPPDDV